MVYDIAKLSPSMSLERLQDNHGAALIRLAKKTMEQNSDMLLELLDTAQEKSSSAIDIKL